MYTHDEFIERLKNENPNKIHPIQKYIKMREAIYFKCDECGYEWKTKPDSVVRKNPTGCPQCAIKRRAETQKMSKEEFMSRAKLNGITLLEEFKSLNSSIKTKCNTCGFEWNAFPDRFLYGDKKFPCPKCSKSIKKTQEEFEEELKQKRGNKFAVIGKYVDALTPIRIKCNECDFEWEPIAVDMIKTNPVSCPRCNRNMGWNTEFFNKRFKINNPTITAIGEYVGPNGTTTLKCDECGYIWNKKRLITTDFVKCPKCKKAYKSFGEYYIANFLTKHNIEFINNYYYEDLKDENYLYYDFWIPSKELLIEFNGRQHYEIVQFGGITKAEATRKFFLQVKHDYMKKKYAKEKGINLITYKYFETPKLKEYLIRDLLDEKELTA